MCLITPSGGRSIFILLHVMPQTRRRKISRELTRIGRLRDAHSFVMRLYGRSTPRCALFCHSESAQRGGTCLQPGPLALSPILRLVNRTGLTLPLACARVNGTSFKQVPPRCALSE